MILREPERPDPKNANSKWGVGCDSKSCFFWNLLTNLMCSWKSQWTDFWLTVFGLSWCPCAIWLGPLDPTPLCIFLVHGLSLGKLKWPYSHHSLEKLKHRWCWPCYWDQGKHTQTWGSCCFPSRVCTRWCYGQSTLNFLGDLEYFFLALSKWWRHEIV